MAKPILALDCDDVLVSFTEMSLAFVNEEFGTSYSVANSEIDWSFSNFPEEHRQYIFERWHDSDLYDGCGLSVDDVAVLEKLRDYYRIIVISSPIEGHMASKMRFLLRYFDKPDIYFAKDKTLIAADILVDDSPFNIQQWPRRAIIMDKPWNRHLTGYPRIHHLTDLYNEDVLW